MDPIRAFRKEDVPQVADLWLRAFRGVQVPAPESLRSYFEEVFFRSPWRDESLPSLVYEEHERVVGFLGVMPRRMIFEGQPIRVAVCTQFMVDPGQHSALPAFNLMRRVFAGPQDLCFSDGATQSSQRIWTTLGGDTALLHSLDWTRILQPTRYALSLFSTTRWPAFLHRALRPVCWGLDAVAARRDPFRVPTPTGAAEETTEAALLACLSQWSGSEALRAAYDGSLGWLLKQAGEKKRHGTLQRRIVRTAKGDIVGWFLYYLKPGGDSTVVQVRARKDSLALVLHHLFRDARENGALAISGQVQPELLDELAASHCLIRCHGLSVLVQSRHPELRAAIHRGDASISRLDGEWCLRFSDYRLGLQT